MTSKSVTWGHVLGRWRGFVLLALLCGITGVAHAGYAAIVVDASTGKVLEQVNADQRDYPASLTKMMTLYLAFQGLKSGRLQLDQPLSVSAWAAGKAPTKLGLRAGQTVSVQDCILGMITKSANDAATVMGEGIGGNEAHFAEMMNAQAALLGMTDTHFANASGLPDPNNTSTAHDLVKLAMALYRDFPQYAHFFATQEFVFRGRIVRGHNNLMYRYPGMDGLKTGYIDASGFNLASTAVRDGRRLFAVVLGGRTAAVRDRLMAHLLDDAFAGQPTSPLLVAAASRGGSRAVRLLKALAPSDATPAGAAPATRRVAVASRRCSGRHGASCRRAPVHHRAKRASAKLAAQRAVAKKPVQVASRRQADG